MARGIIYVMTTVVPGLIKIGKTGLNNFDSRMSTLERNGYANITGLKRYFAIEVDDYDEKEIMLDEIFSTSRVVNTELFALDVDLVVQLLSSFDGVQVYPETLSKEEMFDEATEKRQVKGDWSKIPDGLYYFQGNRRGFGKIIATMKVENGDFIVLKGSICAPSEDEWQPESRRNAHIENNILQEDVVCHSPSTAAHVVRGKATNGWVAWKNVDGISIDEFRKKKL